MRHIAGLGTPRPTGEGFDAEDEHPVGWAVSILRMTCREQVREDVLMRRRFASLPTQLRTDPPESGPVSGVPVVNEQARTPHGRMP